MSEGVISESGRVRRGGGGQCARGEGSLPGGQAFEIEGFRPLVCALL